jgi:hypothetical protein
MDKVTKTYICKITKIISEQFIIEISETVTKAKPRARTKTETNVNVLQKVAINNKKK